MKNKILENIIKEAKQKSDFRFYKGWEESSGYIQGEIYGNGRFDTKFRFYIPISIEDKDGLNETILAPTKEQIDKYVESYFERLAQGFEHSQTLREFSRYITNNYYLDLRKMSQDLMQEIESNLSHVIKALEEYDHFDNAQVQNLHNSLKNYECELMEQDAVRSIVEKHESYKPEIIKQKLIENEFGELVVKKPKKKGVKNEKE